MSSGILPLKALLERSKCRNRERFPINGESVPFNAQYGSKIATTHVMWVIGRPVGERSICIGYDTRMGTERVSPSYSVHSAADVEQKWIHPSAPTNVDELQNEYGNQRALLQASWQSTERWWEKEEHQLPSEPKVVSFVVINYERTHIYNHSSSCHKRAR